MPDLRSAHHHAAVKWHVRSRADSEYATLHQVRGPNVDFHGKSRLLRAKCALRVAELTCASRNSALLQDMDLAVQVKDSFNKPERVLYE